MRPKLNEPPFVFIVIIAALLVIVVSAHFLLDMLLFLFLWVSSVLHDFVSLNYVACSFQAWILTHTESNEDPNKE